MENGAKNKAILLSLWGTTGQHLCQTAANVLPDYFRTAHSDHILTNKTLQGLSFPSTRVGRRDIYTLTHTHIHSPLTCSLIDLSVSGTNYGSAGEERENGR